MTDLLRLRAALEQLPRYTAVQIGVRGAVMHDTLLLSDVLALLSSVEAEPPTAVEARAWNAAIDAVLALLAAEDAELLTGKIGESLGLSGNIIVAATPVHTPDTDRSDMAPVVPPAGSSDA